MMLAAVSIPDVFATIWPFLSGVFGVIVLLGVNTWVFDRISSAKDRRRDQYAEAERALVAWIELCYRIKRRPDDSPDTLKGLAAIGHDIQERLAYHEMWIASDSRRLSAAYSAALGAIRGPVGEACNSAWTAPPASTAASMVLNGWGPGRAPNKAVAAFRTSVAESFRPLGRVRRIGRRPPR